jgi:ParB-like chromosome segregation protein Spo0J
MTDLTSVNVDRYEFAAALKVARNDIKKVSLPAAAATSGTPSTTGTKTTTELIGPREDYAGPPDEKDLAFHPITELFRPMEGAEFDELVADVKANGLREPIVKFRGKILDGRNRYRACLAAGVKPSFISLGELVREPGPHDAWAYVVSKNIHRRHLTAERRRELIVDLIKRQPEKSDRAIAGLAKASPTTVGKVRATVQDGQLSKRVGKDGKARRQPAKEAKPLSAEDWMGAARRAANIAYAASAEMRDETPSLDPETAEAVAEHWRMAASACREAQEAAERWQKPRSD